ncbi:molybdenum ABC transporter ATP-binding protein [Rhodoferax sp. OV413]|uniref:molybdenum ABC transporter ATP-binding protein n=1 Tax=Rhodoferax sp. OV413 TaxID=1855285 RepID=UPI0025E662A6|nr:molybdenum ABC transporter ATP-binding protein [Rhodoferax sp. OV413]
MSGHESLHIRLRLTRADFQLGVDLTLPSSGITVLFGPSGSGKTSLLRCVAGLERPGQARISIGSEVWQDDAAGVYLPTWQRDLGYVFQEASLFEHLNVRQNLHFGLKRTRKPGAEQALAHALELLGIGHLLHRQAGTLSGGERQRVAIARALATQPRILLLDEPLAALDIARRHEILPWLEKMRDELSLPMLYITHSADELARLADHLVVLDQGTVKASGAAQEVLARVDSPVIVGDDAGVVLHGRVVQRDAQWHLAQVAFSGGALWVRDNGLAPGQAVRLRVLARDISISPQPTQDSSIQNHLQARIEAIADDAHPSQALVQLRCAGAGAGDPDAAALSFPQSEESTLLARVTRRAIHTLQLVPGDAVWAQVKSVAVIE